MRHCVLLLFLCCGMAAAYAQDGRSKLMQGFPPDHVYSPRDTAVIVDMINIAWSCVTKAGEEKTDIDSAKQLASLAMIYSKKISFTRGERMAGATLSQIAYEERNVVELVRFCNYIKQPDRVWFLRNMVFMVAFADGSTHPDSLLRWSELTKQAALEVKDAVVANESEFYIGRAHYSKGNQRECKRAFLNMIDYHTRRKDTDSQLEAWYQLSILIDDADTSYPSTVEAAENIIRLSKITGHKAYLGDAYFTAGYGHYVRGKVDKSEAVLLEAEQILFRANDKNRRFVYELLTKIYSVKADGARALHYAEATLDHVRRYDNTPENIRLYSIRLSEVFLHFGKTDEYEATLRSVRVASPPEKATDWFYIIMLGQIMRRTSAQEAIDYLMERRKNVPMNDLVREVEFNREMGLNYSLLQNYPASLSYLSEAERLMQGLDIRFHGTFADVWINMAKSSYLNGQWDNAEKYVTKVESVPKGVVPLNTQLYAEFLRFKIDSARMQYLSAIRHYTRHKTLNDSIANVQKMNELEVLNVRYQTAQKEHQLAQNEQQIAFLGRARTLSDELLRKTQESALQAKIMQDQRLYIVGNESRQRADSLRHAEETNRLLNTEAALNKDLLAQADSRRNWMIAGGVLLALLLLVTYSRYLLKQRSNRQLEQQQALITSKNDSLQKLVYEKEWLLKEVHHRVKNNLQVVMSLLNIQSHYLEDDSAISAIRNSQNRVNAISLIHKKLYQSDNPAMVHMPHYIKELADQLSDYSEQRHDINMILEVEPIVLDINKALPIGLILNEAITNAFKYAFPDGRRGTITVRLTQPTPEDVQLTIADDGIGMPDAEARAEGNSLGMNLMKGLSADMDGGFYIDGKEGTQITVTVKLDTQASSG